VIDTANWLHRTALAAAASTALLGVDATAGVFAEQPDVFVCAVDDPVGALPWNELVFYVSARLEDGSTLYKSLTSNPVLLSVDADRMIVAPNLKDCDGKPVSALREAGRAFDFAQRAGG
jgi:hypothetical protein